VISPDSPDFRRTCPANGYPLTYLWLIYPGGG
jgi:hypothetical protein